MHGLPERHGLLRWECRVELEKGQLENPLLAQGRLRA
jgi:hypothetical protein